MTKAAPPAAHPSLSRLLRIDEAASYLRCSKQHVRNLIDEGRLAAAPIGVGAERKHLRVMPDSISSFLASGDQTQTRRQS